VLLNKEADRTQIHPSKWNLIGLEVSSERIKWEGWWGVFTTYNWTEKCNMSMTTQPDSSKLKEPTFEITFYLYLQHSLDTKLIYT